MLKKLFFILALFIFVCFCILPLPIKKEETFLDYLKEQENFFSKIRSKPKKWVQEQVQEDLHFFTEKKISQKALKATCDAISDNDKFFIVRYRILNNQLYRLTEDLFHETPTNLRDPLPDLLGCPYRNENTIFEKALKTLTQLVDLPDLDFIMNYKDGTHEAFYLTENLQDQAPLLGFAKLSNIPYLILVPDSRSLATWWHNDINKLFKGKNYEGKKLRWDEKTNKAFWRGGPTELVNRVRICEISKDSSDMVDSGLCFSSFNSEKHEKLKIFTKKRASYEEHLQYKYLPVLDGVICTYPGYQWRLLSDSVVFKQESNQIQWFYRALMPFVHYIPIKKDMSDLIETIKWARKADKKCKEIAKNSTKFVLENLMLEDVYYYLYFVLKQYAKLQSFNRTDLYKDTHSNPKWICIQYSEKPTFYKVFSKKHLKRTIKRWSFN